MTKTTDPRRDRRTLTGTTKAPEVGSRRRHGRAEGAPTRSGDWPVVDSVEELVGTIEAREPLSARDSKSGARLERVRAGGELYVLKHMCPRDAWYGRATGALECRPVQVWRSGLLGALPPCIDHLIVGCARDESCHTGAAALVMRDAGPWVVPDGISAVPLEQHLRFLDHMAAVHAAFWGWEDSVGLLPMSNRVLALSPATVAVEQARPRPHPIPALVGEGWARLGSTAPPVAAVVTALFADPSPLLVALDATPATFVHGDWKLTNLGTAPDGRTLLLDWDLPGRAPACWDLAWYLAVNCDRLPQSKDDAILAFRQALEGHGRRTAGWWERQLGLCLIGAFMVLGWEKAAQPAELSWWRERVVGATRWLS